MAQIKMDVSEYEAMKENKALLENALSKQSDLQDQIKQLNKEKIEALEAASMKVVKFTKSEATEHLWIKNEISYIDAFKPTGYTDDLEFATYRLILKIGEDSFIRRFFKKKTVTKIPIDTVTTHGLDDIKLELKKEIEDRINYDTKEKFSKADLAIEENQSLLSENRQLSDYNKRLIKENKDIIKDSECIDKRNEELTSDSSVLQEIARHISRGVTFWNRSRKIKEILSMIDKK